MFKGFKKCAVCDSGAHWDCLGQWNENEGEDTWLCNCGCEAGGANAPLLHVEIPVAPLEEEKMTKHFTLDVYHYGPDAEVDGFDYAVVELSKGHAKELLRLIFIVRELQERLSDESVQRLSLWNKDACFFGGDQDAHTNDKEDSPTEYDILHVYEDHVMWESAPCNFDSVYVETEPLSFERIREVALSEEAHA